MTTPAKKMGLIAGVTRLKREGDFSNVWILEDDDGSHCPFFKTESGDDNNRVFGLSEMSIIQEVPAPPVPAFIPAGSIMPVAPALPVVPAVYTELQQKAINTFQGMYDAAVLYREGLDNSLRGECGICDNISRFATYASADSNQMAEVKENLIRTTASYSGEYTYPVKGVEGRTASSSFSFFDNKWKGGYGFNRLTQLGELIDIIKSDKWDDCLINRQTPAFRNGLKVGDVVQYKNPHRTQAATFWVFRHDDHSSSPSFHKLGDKDDYTDLDLDYVKKVKSDMVKERPVSEFLSEIEAQVKIKTDLERQVAELQARLNEVTGDIAMLDYGLADQHKVKRI